MKIIYFNFAAIAVLIMLLAATFIRGMTKGRTNRFFIYALFEVLITVIFDIFAVYLDNMGAGHVTEKYLTHGGYLFGHTFTALFYLMYLISLTDTWHRFKDSFVRRLVLTGPAVFYVAHFIVQWCGGPRVFYINEFDVYTRGELFYVGYVVGAFYILYGMYYIIKFRKLFTPKWIFTLFSFMPFVALAMVVEYFTPSVIIELFANSLAFMFIAFVVQKPEALIDPITGLGSAVAFEEKCKKNILNEKDFVEVLFFIKNYESIRAMLDNDSSRTFTRDYARNFVKIGEKYKLKAGIYNGRHGSFHLVMSFIDDETIKQFTEELLIDLNTPGVSAGVNIAPQTSICVIKVPEDFDDMKSLMNFCNHRGATLSCDKVYYAEELIQDRNFKMELVVDRIVEEGIANDRLDVFFQPIYSFEDNAFTMAEALIRLKDPDYGFVPPDIFIPAAEKSGSINRLWEFVFHKVCRFIASEAFKQSDLKSIDINLSAVQCMNPNLADSIIETIDAYGVPRSSINIEITETAFAYNVETLSYNIQKLHNAGITLSLDDYGTGYSDTGRIVTMPFDVVKLDKGFIWMARSTDKESVIGNIIKLMKDIDKKVVAEGVETEEVLDMLDEMDCDYIQGYYFSKPLPADEFADFLRGSLGGVK